MASLTEHVLGRWPEGIPPQDYPELIEVFQGYLELAKMALVEDIMKSYYRNGQWYHPNGEVDTRQIKRLMEAVEAGQAPGVRASLSFAEQERLTLTAGEPIQSYKQFEEAGFTLDSSRFSNRPPSIPAERRKREAVQQMSNEMKERMSRMHSDIRHAPEGSIDYSRYQAFEEADGSIRLIPIEEARRRTEQASQVEAPDVPDVEEFEDVVISDIAPRPDSEVPESARSISKGDLFQHAAAEFQAKYGRPLRSQ